MGNRALPHNDCDCCDDDVLRYRILVNTTSFRPNINEIMNKLGIVQTILWTVGMLFMSGSMHIQGLLGGPRRSDFSTYGGTEQAQTWINYQLFQAIGGTILFIAIILLVYIYVK